VIGHLGPRTSALLDGQLSPADEERAWDHVHSCHQCRDAVEREGWVKTRLARMQFQSSAAPSHLKGSLLFGAMVACWDDGSTVADGDLAGVAARARRHLGMVGISSGAIGAAVMGVLALGASPANAPGVVNRPTGSSLNDPIQTAITSVIERGRPEPAGPRNGSHLTDARLATAGSRRTLAP
jgi:hypothetical protein